jgi:uncharacterized protein involved in exopolysaccharide biosynthesis
VKKSSAYRETFRRRRVLLSLPIVIATLIGAWLVIGAPKSYDSTVSLWVDNPASSTSSIQDLNPSLTPPSQQEQTILSELLATDTFDQQVASQSSLGSYLASNPSTGSGPTALLGKLSGGGGSIANRIAAALSAKNVVSAVPGPQILQITYSGPTPEVSQSTLKAIVAVLQKETARYLAQHNQASLGYDESQVQTARTAVSTARDAENAYLAQHPGANQGDPAMAALISNVAAATSQLAQANSALTAAKAANSGAAGNATVIDAPDLPASPTGGKKKEIEGVLGGLIAGIFISLLGTIALTRGKSDPWEEELAERPSEGLALVGKASVPATAAAPAKAAAAGGHSNLADLLIKSGATHGGSHRLARGSSQSGPPAK